MRTTISTIYLPTLRPDDRTDAGRIQIRSSPERGSGGARGAG